MNEKSFESRRVRTQPWTWMAATGAVLCNAFFTEVGESMEEVDRGSRSDKQKQARPYQPIFPVWTRHFNLSASRYNRGNDSPDESRV